MQYVSYWYKLVQIGKQDEPWKSLGEIFKENELLSIIYFVLEYTYQILISRSLYILLFENIARALFCIAVETMKLCK